MTTNREVYEGKILETLIKNSERLAVVGQKLISLDKKIEQKFNFIELKLSAMDIKYEERFNRYEERFERIEKKFNLQLTLISTVSLGILATLYAQQILNALN